MVKKNNDAQKRGKELKKMEISIRNEALFKKNKALTRQVAAAEGRAKVLIGMLIMLFSIGFLMWCSNGNPTHKMMYLP